MNKDVFIDVLEKLKSIGGLRYTGENWGQLEFEQPPVNFPCALVDIDGAEFTGNGVQQAVAAVVVTVADIRYNPVTAALDMKRTEREFVIFDLIAEVNKKLHGMGGADYSRLCRVALKKIDREDSIREFRIIYRFSFLDSTANPAYTHHPAPPKIEVGI